MYNVILCDDDMNFIPYMQKMLEQTGFTEENTIFYKYNSGKEMLDDITTEKSCDLLVLDIQMPGLDGNETALEFRRVFPAAVLVFCTGESKPTPNLFKVSPFRYLLKEYTDDEIIEELKDVREEVKKRAGRVKYIEGHYRNNSIKVSVANILFIEKAKRGSRIYVSKDCKEDEFGEIILSDYKLGELHAILQNVGFEYAHSSYIVNFNCIEKIMGCELHMCDRRILTLSRNYISDFRLKYTKWVAGKY